MRKTSWIFVILLGIGGSDAAAQSVGQPSAVATADKQRWDAGVTAGLFSADPVPSDSPYNNDWYFEGRYAVSVGRFWTDHLKTEIEFATTGEGSRYVQRFSTVPGVPPNYPYSVEEYYRLNQASGRVVWQFFDNVWVHPYVFGGVAYEAERRRVRVPEQYYFSNNDPRNPANQIVMSQGGEIAPHTVHRAAAIAGAGAKVYMAPTAYFNAGFVMSRSQPSQNVSFIAGFGWDF